MTKISPTLLYQLNSQKQTNILISLGDTLVIKYFLSIIKNRKQTFIGKCISLKKNKYGTFIRIINDTTKDNVTMQFPLNSPMISEIKILKTK